MLVRDRLEDQSSSFAYARLSDEFAGRVDPETIRRVVEEEAAFFHDTRVKDFVPILAWRRARARLLEEAASRVFPTDRSGSLPA
jgi:hypothetical protein